MLSAGKELTSWLSACAVVLYAVKIVCGIRLYWLLIIAFPSTSNAEKVDRHHCTVLCGGLTLAGDASVMCPRIILITSEIITCIIYIVAFMGLICIECFISTTFKIIKSKSICLDFGIIYLRRNGFLDSHD